MPARAQQAAAKGAAVAERGRLWIENHSTTYGAFGIIIAIVFWIIPIGTVLVLAAALSPALAERRDLLEAHGQGRA